MGETTMTWPAFPFRVLLLAAGALCATATTSALADTDSEAVALGYQTEHADIVLVGVAEKAGGFPDPWASSPVKVVYTAEAVLRGTLDHGGPVVVVLEHDLARSLATAPARQLLFLTLAEGGTHHRPLVGAASVRPLPHDGPAARFPDAVARYAAALRLPASQRDEALRDELVRQIEDEDPGLAWSGATDLYRRGDLVAGLSQSHAARIVAAFAGCDAMDRTKEALALVVALCGDPGAAAALADAVDADDAGSVKGGLGDAAELLGGDELAAELVSRLAAAGPERRAALVSVLGRVGREGCSDAVLPLLRDADPAVRVEALHACGRIARNVRWIERRRRAAAGTATGRGAGTGSEPDTAAASAVGGAPTDPGPQPPDDGVGRPAPGTREQPRGPTAWEAIRVRMRIELSRSALRARPRNEKRAALWSLAQLDDPAAYAFLRRLAADSGDDGLRRDAATYLAHPGQSLILR